ncbi:hypothetical protein [Phyllobacterium bourgognense]|uniref:hypothetical protein n=1 Tax=Phyllobacterium bourgognense TaxID=314236 RepID=UPI000DF352B7|nr:hypothetical protein [Phyllobacterium bourgognense]
MKRLSFSIIFGCAALMMTSANAERFELKMFGHEVFVASGGPEGDILKIDGREVHKNQIITFEELVTVDGVAVLIGSSAKGGNSCDGAPFVVSFPANSNPRIDGPLETCYPTTMAASPSQLEFSTAAQPGSDGEKWIWTPADGFKQVAGEKFAATSSKGWAQLRERTVTHPNELLGYKEIADEINRIAGSNRKTFETMIGGVGSAESTGDLFVGTSCTPHNCDAEAAILIASIPDKRVYLAWKPETEKIVVLPPVKQWPQNAKNALLNWSRKWK